VIPEGRDGICRVRSNRGGTLLVPRGYVASLAVEPIEKKPFFHALPGSRAASFGMLGCDYHCPFCQNWLTSQVLREPAASGLPPIDIEPEEIVAIARRTAARSVISTYNEPLITTEWAVEIFARAREAGLACGYVSNGNGTPEVLRYLRPYADLFKIDLKAWRPEAYRALGGRVENVLETIRLARAMGFWVEVVTLVVPGFNDGAAELESIARFIASVSPEIPWHVTAFRPEFHMTESPATLPADLRRAAAIGREAGLHFVYAGNLPGEVGELESTRCPACGRTLIARLGSSVSSCAIGPDGACPSCGARIPGYWKIPAPPPARP
jgi:pyruvate formate lyase activating enzyme